MGKAGFNDSANDLSLSSAWYSQRTSCSAVHSTLVALRGDFSGLAVADLVRSAGMLLDGRKWIGEVIDVKLLFLRWTLAVAIMPHGSILPRACVTRPVLVTIPRRS